MVTVERLPSGLYKVTDTNAGNEYVGSAASTAITLIGLVLMEEAKELESKTLNE